MNTAYNITSKFQVTIPKELRDQLKLTADDRVSFERRGQEIIIKKTPTLKKVSKILQADLRRRGWDKTVTQEDMNQAKDVFYKKGLKWQ